MKLRCENLVKKYGPRTVVKGVSMEVNQGEIVGFLGPNGAGKTTSFYMITGLIVPNDGKIFTDDAFETVAPPKKEKKNIFNVFWSKAKKKAEEAAEKTGSWLDELSEEEL